MTGIPSEANVILGIDTTTAVTSAALMQGGLVCAEASAPSIPTSGSAESVIGLADTCLKQAGVSISAVTAIAVNIGPGSFTGIRNGIATAQGLALSRDLPVYGISGMLAFGVDIFSEHSLAVVTATASKNETYLLFLVCCERNAATWKIKVLSEVMTVPSVDLVETLVSERARLEAEHEFVKKLNGQPVAIELVENSSFRGRCGAAQIARAVSEIEVVSSAFGQPLYQVCPGGAGLFASYVKGVNARTLVERGLRE